MIFQRRLLLSINMNAVQRRKHPARNERYGFPIPSDRRQLLFLADDNYFSLSTTLTVVLRAIWRIAFTAIFRAEVYREDP